MPYIDYCDLMYKCTTVANLNKLQMIQNAACRVILQVDKDTSIAYMHKELELMTLTGQRNYHLSVECYKYVNSPFEALCKFFIPRSVNTVRTTRGMEANTMCVPNIVSSIGSKAFSFHGPNHWNKIDVNLRSIATLIPFQNALLKEFLRDVNHPG